MVLKVTVCSRRADTQLQRIRPDAVQEWPTAGFRALGEGTYCLANILYTIEIFCWKIEQFQTLVLTRLIRALAETHFALRFVHFETYIAFFTNRFETCPNNTAGHLLSCKDIKRYIIIC
jgi:hypothetical protein